MQGGGGDTGAGVGSSAAAATAGAGTASPVPPPPSPAAHTCVVKKVLPVQLGEPHVYLSERQRSVCARYPCLRSLAKDLPGWVPQRRIARARGFSVSGIVRAVAHLGGRAYVWATEFENTHSMWRFKEPSLSIDGTEYSCSYDYYHAQKPRPFDDAVWLPHRVGVMRRAVRAKFAADPALAQLLRATGLHPLLALKRDRFWGFHAKSGGENMLARLLEELRAELLLQAREEAAGAGAAGGAAGGTSGPLGSGGGGGARGASAGAAEGSRARGAAAKGVEGASPDAPIGVW